MTILTYNEGKCIILDTFGVNVIYNDCDYDGSDGLTERIDIYTILKIGFLYLLTNTKKYPKIDNKLMLVHEITDFLCTNRNRWDGPQLGTNKCINLTINQVKDTRYKIQKNTYYFGKTNSLFPLSFIDSKRDFIQKFVCYDENLLYTMTEKILMETIVEKLIRSSVEDWLCIDNDINLGKNDSMLKYIHKDFIRMNSEFIYKCLDNKPSILREIEFYNFIPNIYKLECDIFWKVINPCITISTCNININPTLLQIGTTTLHAKTRDFFVQRHFKLITEKYCDSGVIRAYISLFINWIVKFYILMYRFYYLLLKNMFVPNANSCHTDAKLCH